MGTLTRRSVLGIFVAAAPWLAAQDLPKAETILDRYIEVTGGAAAYEKITSEHMLGTLNYPAMGITGKVERYAATPDKYYTTLDITGIGKTEMGFGDGIAWEKSAMLGSRVKTGEERAQTVREATLNATYRWKQLYAKVETTGTESVDGEDCYKVVMTPKEGKPETMYFQKKSGLAVKVTTVAASQMGDIPVEVIASDYKEFGGIKVATKTTQKAAGQEFSITIDKVETNVAIPASRFDVPADVKALNAKGAK